MKAKGSINHSSARFQLESLEARILLSVTSPVLPVHGNDALVGEASHQVPLQGALPSGESALEYAPDSGGDLFSGMELQGVSEAGVQKAGPGEALASGGGAALSGRDATGGQADKESDLAVAPHMHHFLGAIRNLGVMKFCICNFYITGD